MSPRADPDTVAGRDADGSAPETPTDLKARSWGAVFKRTLREFKEDNLTDWAAALTYCWCRSTTPTATRWL
jgi:membrane protein